MPALEIHITGRVQGVSFRANTQAQARALELVGWVKNEADGSVRAWAQGPRAQLDALVSWCREGPRFASVSAVNVQEAAEDPALHVFEIWR